MNEFQPSDSESWEDYWFKHKLRLGNFDLQFVRQIIYENLGRLLHCCPWFSVNTTVEREKLRTDILLTNTRYDDDYDIAGEWVWHFEEGREGYLIYDWIVANQTWPFPIVLLSNPSESSPVNCSAQYLLVEGTHRLSYLNAIHRSGKVGDDREHEVFIIHYAKQGVKPEALTGVG